MVNSVEVNPSVCLLPNIMLRVGAAVGIGFVTDRLQFQIPAGPLSRNIGQLSL